MLADRVVGPILCADEREQNMEAPSPAKRYIFVICCLHQSSMVDPSSFVNAPQFSFLVVVS